MHGHKDIPSTQWTDSVKKMLEKGEDPKELLIEVCRPICKHLEDKKRRCEVKLKSLTHADPEKSCMYPLRDWITCVDGCVVPKIHEHLIGHEKGWLS